jgi:hypothetical protein
LLNKNSNLENKLMSKGIIYYTDNRLDKKISLIVQKEILKANLPIVSISLKPINFGENIVLEMQPGFIAMQRQILAGLHALETQFVFFCEHDVLYPLAHFEFTPAKDNIFYYNANVWRWKYPDDIAITYDRLISLSGLCVNREFALEHYRRRLKTIEERNLDKNEGHEPMWARKWGYEPGTKKIKRGGFSDDDFETWKSHYPIVDIRHGKTFSQSKVTIDSFKHKPTNWTEIKIKDIPGWDLEKLFNI